MNRKLLTNHSSFIIRKSAGFTLIELLIAMGIIGILSSFLLANFIGVRQRARDGVRKSDLRQIQASLELYRSDKGVYPATLTACGTSFTDGAAIPVVYMQKIPCDPINTTPYIYQYSPSGAAYYLTACLENVNDSQKDSANNLNPPGTQGCDGTKNWSYTLQNP